MINVLGVNFRRDQTFASYSSFACRAVKIRCLVSSLNWFGN